MLFKRQIYTGIIHALSFSSFFRLVMFDIAQFLRFSFSQKTPNFSKLGIPGFCHRLLKGGWQSDSNQYPRSSWICCPRFRMITTSSTFNERAWKDRNLLVLVEYWKCRRALELYYSRTDFISEIVYRAFIIYHGMYKIY